ncbi:MAG: serine protease, partial [Planctomycetota bacterium]|nr:serine protease [Planctomycetota bacterium]
MVRIVAPENQAHSLGSGTLVHVTEQHGLVITNWHVVRDATGPVQVLFADGFRSAGTVMKTDDEWDLAAIGIWRPQAEPIAIAATAPRPGDVLTIAGYGPGPFRAVSGRCIQYVAPSKTDPNQMIELSAEAREGDSGGPILNSQGQLAGVLLGARGGRTVGSYFGRVDQFLADVRSIMDRTAQGEWIARQSLDPLAPLPQPNDTFPPKDNRAEQKIASQARRPAWPDTVVEPLETRRDLATTPFTPPVEIPIATAAAQIRRPVAAIDSGGQDEFFRPAITPYPSLAEPSRSEQILPARHSEDPARMTR